MTGHQSSKTHRLGLRVTIRLIMSVIIMGVLFFIPAGSWGYLEAWVYIAVVFIPMVGVFVYLLKKDPLLLERRMQAKEKKNRQQTIIRLTWPFFLLLFLIPGFDFRYGWSQVAAPIWIAADGVVFCGYMLFFRVLLENSYASRIIEVAREQHVIDTGPYAVIRHPMYLAVIVMYGASPMALGSWWAMPPILPIIVLIICRIIDEEKVLLRELPGYAEYVDKVRYRLLPRIW